MQSENPSQLTILEPLCYSSFVFATLVHGVIGYKFWWLLPQSRSTSWTWISWDTNWAWIRVARCHPPAPHLKADDTPSWRCRLGTQGVTQSPDLPPTRYAAYALLILLLLLLLLLFLPLGCKGLGWALIFILFYFIF